MRFDTQPVAEAAAAVVTPNPLSYKVREVLSETLSTINTSNEFPPVAQDIVQWGRWTTGSDFILAALAVLLALAFVIIAVQIYRRHESDYRRAVKKYENDLEMYHVRGGGRPDKPDDSVPDWVIGGVLGFGILGLCGLVMITPIWLIPAGGDMLKAQTAPRLYIVEYVNKTFK